MLKNKIIIKRIRNICILLMAIIIMIGVYNNIRRSRAENVIPIEIEISDKSEILETQKIIVEATETSDGNYLLNLPTAVNGNIVTKYYKTDDTEVVMNEENTDKTLTLTETEVEDRKMQLQTDYDKKEVTTEDGETITLYNRELLDEKKTEEVSEQETTNETNESNVEETQNQENENPEKPELDDNVIVTGYMPIDAQIDINEIDTSTISEIQLPEETQTIQKAYEVSIYEIIQKTIDENGNVIATEVIKPENTTKNEDTDNTNANNETAENQTQTNETAQNNISENETLPEGTHIEEEKVEYDPSLYNETLIIKTKNTEENTMTTIYQVQENNQINLLESTVEEEYIKATIEKNNETIRYIVATQPILMQNQASNELLGNSGATTLAITDGNMLKNTSSEYNATSGFLGNTSIQRQNIDNITFLSSTSGANSTAWDVSAAGNNSILAWYETNPNGTLKVYIGSNQKIYANTDSSGLFRYIGYSNNCTSTETITNIELLNTNYVTNMEYMFSFTGYRSMTNLDLKGNFDTSNVTIMRGMFMGTGCEAMSSLNLGNNFDTSNVTDMNNMFNNTGFEAMTSLDLGDKFDTSQVTDMNMMFNLTGYKAMTSLDLGPAFTNISTGAYENIFYETGKSGEIVVRAPKEIYQDSTHFKLNKNATATIEFTRGIIKLINTLRSTENERYPTSGFLGNTSIQRQNIDNVIFLPTISGHNSTFWDVSAEGNCSIIAWYETNSNGTLRVCIGSDEEIYANTNSAYLFSYIGYSKNCTSAETITNIGFLNTSQVTDMSSMFEGTGYTAMTSLDLGDKFDTSSVTNMYCMFWGTGYTAMTSLDLGDKFDTSQVTDMSSMFEGTGYTAMTSLDLGEKFDTSQVTYMSFMFYETGYTAMTSLDLGDKFNTSNVTTMMGMFNRTGYTAMTSLDLRDNFDTGNVTDMYDMFSETGYTAMTSLDLGDKFDTSQVTDMSSMFRETGYTAMTSLDLGDNFDTGNVTNMYNMFSETGYTAMTSLDLGEKFDTSQVTDMGYMFSETGYTAMTSIDLGEKFDTSQVTDMSYMFNDTGYTAMTSLDLGDKFDTSQVTDMSSMFEETGYTAMTSLDLGDKFDTSSVTNMYCMFWGTGYEAMTSLDLGEKFDTSQVTDMSYMFNQTGSFAMTSLDLGEKFDTSQVTNMSFMFQSTGYYAMTSLDLGDKFDTSSVTNMYCMFWGTGYTAMTSLDLGPAFTHIPDGEVEYNGEMVPAYYNMFYETGKEGQIVIQAPEAIYQDSTHFKLNTDSTTTIGWTEYINGEYVETTTYGTINPKYRTEWIKENVQIDQTQANNPKLNITIRGTTNTEVGATEYISDVTGSFTANDIKIYIDDTEITDIVTKTVGTATQTTNTRTGAQDVLQVITLSNFEEVSRQTGKSYREWSGNIRIEIAQGTLSDTTGPADENGTRITYGNKNMEVASEETQTGATTGAGTVTEIGARIDNIVQEQTKLDKNTANALFVDLIKPEFTYTYSTTDINHNAQTLTVEFSVTDKYYNSTTAVTNKDSIIVKMLDSNAVPENLTKTITKIQDITETRDNSEVKIGEKYRLVISGFEQATIGNNGYKEYSGPVSIIFPAGIASDKSGNENNQKNITIGINEPEGTGNAEIVDLVKPVWEAKNLNIDKANNRITVELHGTDKYYQNDTLDINKIKVLIDGQEITSTTNVIKQLSEPLYNGTVVENPSSGQTENLNIGVVYTLTLSNWKESDSQFEASGRTYREYSGKIQLQIEEGTLVDEHGNENVQTTLDLGKIDLINPEITKISSNVDTANKKQTIVFDIIDKDFATAQIDTANTSKIHVYVDNEEATGVTKTIKSVENLTEMINGSNTLIGKRYTLELTNFEQPRTAINYNREYSDWSGDVSIKIDAGTATDNSGNGNEETTIQGDFVDFINANVTYQYAQTNIDYDGKNFTMVFDVTDKFYTSGTLSINDLTIRIDGEEPDWTKVSKSLQVANRTNTVNGASKVIGKRYTVTLSNLEQLQVKEGDNYLDYSGVVTVAIPANKLFDTTGNGNKATTITSGINLPGGTGTGEIVDVVDPLVEKISSTVNIVKDGTAEMIFRVTDKYFDNSTLTNANIRVFINGSEVTTGITKQLTNTSLTEERVVNGTTSTVQYGIQYNLKLSGINTGTVNQIKIKIPQGLVTDESGNGNEETELMLYNTLKSTSTEVNISGANETAKTSPFMGNTNIQRQNIDNVTFVDNIPDNVYDVSTNTYKNSTAWDVSAQGDDSIIAWYEQSANGTVKIYIGSNDEIFGNTNSGYLFAFVGYSNNCTSTETISNLELLNTENVTSMDSMFWNAGYTKMTSLDLGEKFDTSDVTEMRLMFDGTGYTAMTSLDLGDKFDTSNVTNMYCMFYYTGYVAMTSFNLGDKFDTSKVTNMGYMFDSTGYTAMTSLDLGDKFYTSNVTNMDCMFYYTGYNAMTNFDLGQNFDTSKVTNMRFLFASTGYKKMTSLDLGEKFDTSNVTNMYAMFHSTGYTAMTSLDLGEKFDTSSVTNMYCMFWGTGYTAMTSLDLGEKFDTSNVTDMNGMFNRTGYTAMTSLDLGDKFNTSKVTDMNEMFTYTGTTAMTNLELGPAFTHIAEIYTDMFMDTGKSGQIVINAPEAIYQDRTHFKLNTDSATTIEFTRGTINPKYRTEWIKEGTQVNKADVNNPKLNITLRGTTNTEVANTEYISDVTSSLTVNDIKIYIDNTEITDIITKTIGTATQTTNPRTGANDVLQVITLSNFEEATRRVGKEYKEWSGNIRIEIAQGTLSDTTGPADAEGNKTTYGNKNMAIADDGNGTRIDNYIQNETKVDKNTTNAMFADFVKPEFTYTYSTTDINSNVQTLTVEFSVTDKYFNTSTVLNNKENITIKMLDTNVVPENLTKTITKIEDITENRDSIEVKIGEKYRLVISGFEQASIENGKYKEYSGPVSIIFPEGIISDKSANENNQKNITIGINEPDNTGNAEIVDVVRPIWEAKNLNIDKENGNVTVELYGTDKYYENCTLNVNNIQVIIDGVEITSTTNVVKQLSAPTPLTETRDGTNVQYGVKYILTLNNWNETDSQFEASGRQYREYSGDTQIKIAEGTLVDESGNENTETTLELGMIDMIRPEVIKVSSTVSDDNQTETIVFDIVDKHFVTSQITTTDTSSIRVFVDNEEAIGVTKTITNIQDLTANVNGTSKVIGKRYTLVISNFEQPRITINYDKEYSNWSGNVDITIDRGTATDEFGNSN